jgi:DNA-binding response OmpR family regulator/HD-like signal output (HDOD) protein
MTEESRYRALVVEDEPAVKSMIVLALEQVGIRCDTAPDGNEAEKLVARTQYDVVVTDLLMPNKHGHALATHLLTLHRRPVIVIHTGFSEPRLAKDLLERGVDDIIFKPFNFSILAAKVKALVERRFPTTNSGAFGSNSTQGAAGDMHDDPQQDESPESWCVTLANLNGKLSRLSRLLPISSAALDVYAMTDDDRTQVPQLAAAIQRDPACAAEMLRLANSSFYNCSTQPVVQLEQAVVRIGHKRIGELALGMTSLAALTTSLVPWMDVELAWRQSMAAGLAIELLIEQGGHQKIEEGLLLSAIMHPLGRVALGTLYPGQYEKMIAECQFSGESLQEREQVVFPLSHTEALDLLLTTWNVPQDVRSPLSFLLKDYQALVAAPESIRTKAELVKIAAFVGRLAVGRWEPWDLIDVPPAALLKRLGVQRIGDIIAETQADVERLTRFRLDPTVAEQTARTTQPSRELGYCDFSNLAFDFVGMLLPSMGIAPLIHSEHDLGDVSETVLLNCVGMEPDRISAFVGDPSRLAILTDAARAERFKEFGRTIVLPSSYSCLRSACWESSHPINGAKETAGSLFAHWA